MRAVLMAGGSGTRLRPLTCDIPKPMVPVMNKPIIEHIIDLLKLHGVQDIMVTLYYLPQVIQDYLGDGSQLGINLGYSVEDKIPLGTAGSVKQVERWIDGTFIVISGDSLTDMDLTKAVAFHKEKRAKCTIVLKRVSNPLDYGVVILEPDGRIQRFMEKPTSSEVFSDTVNTGTYILEPEIFNDMGEGEVDFSKDVFPLLLKRGDPMYGYIAEDGYWCDIGNLDAYRQAHYDVLEGRVKIKVPYNEVRPQVWIGDKTEIDPSVNLEGPLVIGHNCLIEADVVLAAGTVMGDNVVVSQGSSLKRPIIWNNVHISAGAALRGCVIGKNTIVRNNATVLEGTIVSNNCLVGEGATVRPGIKLWPGKIIEAGATVTESIIWGSAMPRGLFDKLGISGSVNVELTPEFVTRIAAAYGATLGIGQRVQVSRDPLNASRMINRAFISGLQSVGIDVVNLEDTPMPISRYQIPSQDVAGGIHTRINLDDKTKVTIEFLDKTGLNVSAASEKKIETTYLREDFRRARLGEIGEISFPPRAREYYLQGFMQQVTACRPPGANPGEKRRLKVVVDYAFQADTVMLPAILGKMGLETIVLNATLRKNPPAPQEVAQLQRQLVDVVLALKADFGVQLDGNGERFALVTNRGEVVSGNHLTALMTEFVLRDRADQAVAVTVTAPQVIERIAGQHGCRVVRTKATSRALMEGAQQPGVILAGWGGRFILPYFHPGFDSLFASATLAELMAYRPDTLSEVLRSLPALHFRHEQIPCPWEKKGLVMRQMVERSRGQRVEMLDGIKIYHKDGAWALILPDAVMPLIHLYLDSDSALALERLSEEYQAAIAEVQAGAPAGVTP